MSIKALLSRADGVDQEVDLAGWQARGIQKDQLLWIDVESPTQEDVSVVSTALGLDESETRRLERDPDRPEATVLTNAVEVIVVALAEGIEDDPVPLQLLIGDGWAVTNHCAPIPFLAEHWAMIQDQREVGRLTAVEFLAEVLDWHLDAIVDAAEALESEVDQLDDAALRTESHLLERLVQMRSRIARLRRILNPHREVLAELVRPDFLPDGDGESRPIVELTDRLDRAQDRINNVREMLIGTFDIHMTRTAQRTNDVMRVLTLASVVLLPPVVVAGVMGMNFRVGMFDEPNLFWVVVGAMAVLALTTVVVARWRRWL